MEALQSFIVPLLWLVPLVLALVNWVKANAPGLPAWSLAPIAMVIGVAAALVAVYFTQMQPWAQVIVAGAAIGGTASGVFDISKLFGTFTGPDPTSTAE